MTQPQSPSSSSPSSASPPTETSSSLPISTSVVRPIPISQQAVVYSASPRPRWPWIAAGVTGALALTALGTIYGFYASWLSGERIAPGLIVQGTAVGGLTPGEARRQLYRRFGRLFVTFQTPDGPRKLALLQVGGRPAIDRAVQNAYWFGRSQGVARNVLNVYQARRTPRRLPLAMKWDKPKMRRTMWTVATQYKRQPRDASLQVGPDGVQITPEQIGRSLNVGATLANLQKSYFVGRPAIKAVGRITAPRLRAVDLEGRDVELGHYSTYFDSGLWGRTRNIHVAASEIDRRVLMPGQSLSFNQCTGERTWDKGYRMAHVFERQPGADKSEVVDGLAGGVCQVSSTLFNAVRRSNRRVDGQLAIVERSSHSLPVTYVPSGLDATVAWPDRDFRFRNTLPHPVWVRARVDGSKLVIGIWGRVPYNAEGLQKIRMASERSHPKSANPTKRASLEF